MAFFQELLLHTKGTYARKRFKLADWQREEIVRPIFGETVWSDEHQAYKRRYSVAWIEIARKALAIETPILTVNRGWVTIADIEIGDEVHALGGDTTVVDWVSPEFTEERFEVRSGAGRSLLAGADHDWTVLDDRGASTVMTTAEIISSAEAFTLPDGDPIASIIPVGRGRTRCIGVEHSDKTFLAGSDMVPTSNCGKTEILAGIMLYIFLAEGEYGAELYSVAKDRKQASLCFDVAAQMVLLNPILSKRCKVIKSTKRIVKLDSNSVYQVIANDADSALGSNPSAVAADELLAWPSVEMWDALYTGMGSKARLQPLLIAATTAGSDTESFGGQKHTEMVKIAENPSSAPHVFTFIRNTPRDADPFDEKNWYYANPALGDFLGIEKMREMADNARRNPLNLRGFQQFQLNQWTSSSVAWYPMHVYDDCAGTIHASAQLTMEAFAGRECWLGIDLAARQDLCCICYLFPDGDGGCDLLWRFWLPETQFWKLNAQHNGRFVQWSQDGWIQVTEGDVLDFQKVYTDIEEDARRFTILGADADKWSSDPVIQEIQSRTYISDIMAYENQFRHMSDGMHRVLELGKQKKMRHHGNPVARWCFDSCEARIAPYNPDLIRPDKPNRGKVAKRIDAVPAAIMAVNAWTGRGSEHDSVYASSDVMTVNF